MILSLSLPVMNCSLFREHKQIDACTVSVCTWYILEVTCFLHLTYSLSSSSCVCRCSVGVCFSAFKMFLSAIFCHFVMWQDLVVINSAKVCQHNRKSEVLNFDKERLMSFDLG